jgi:hypothetical protein
MQSTARLATIEISNARWTFTTQESMESGSRVVEQRVARTPPSQAFDGIGTRYESQQRPDRDSRILPHDRIAIELRWKWRIR